MKTCFAAFILALLLSAVVTYFVRAIALRLGLVDQPDNYRKLHDHPIPRLGGIGIFIAFFTPLLALAFLYRNTVSAHLLTRPVEFAGFAGGSAVALALGIADDLRDIRARYKLLLQAVAATVAWFGGLSINVISNPFGSPINLGWLGFPVTVFWFVGCMNAVNLMDGLDGLAAGVCLFVTLTLFIVSVIFHNVLGMLLMASLSGAILGFLFFNFHPASIFLGDSGSMLLGFLVAALSLIGTMRKAETAVALAIPIVALGLPILDTSLSILRRWYRKLPLAAPDRHHIHHMLVSTGLSQRNVVLILYSASVLLGAAALLITLERSRVTILVLGSLALIAFVCVRVLGGVRLEDVLDRFVRDSERRQTSNTARVSVEKALQQMRASLSTGGLWEACSNAFKDIGLDYATLQLRRKDGSEGEAMSWYNQGHWRTEEKDEGADRWSGQVEVRHGRELLGALDIGIKTRGSIPMAEIPELVDLLRQEIADSLKRLSIGYEWPQGGRPPAAETLADTIRIGEPMHPKRRTYDELNPLSPAAGKRRTR